jgi:DNA-binding NtrC family response regulator
MNGFQLVQQLTRQKPGLPVVYVSGYPGKKSQWGDDFQECIPFLHKPFTLTSLLMALKETLAKNADQTDGQTRL